MYHFLAMGGEAQILNDWLTNILSEFTLGEASSFVNGWNWKHDSD